MDMDIIKQGQLLIAVGGCPGVYMRPSSGCGQCVYRYTAKFTTKWIASLGPTSMYPCEREVMTLLTTKYRGG